MFIIEINLEAKVYHLAINDQVISEIEKGSFHNNLALEESKEGTSTIEPIEEQENVELELPLVLEGQQQALEEQKENRRSNDEIPNRFIAVGSKFHLFEQDVEDSHEVQAAAEVHRQSQKFDVTDETQEGFQEQNLNPVGSVNLKESNTEIAKVSFQKDSAPESSVGTSSEVLIDKQPHIWTDPQQAHLVYKVSLPLPCQSAMLSPSSTSITTTSPTSKAPVSSSKQKHQIAEELADFHGPSSCSHLLDEAFVKVTGSDIHLVKQDGSHNEVQGASEFQLHLQNFEEVVDIRDSLQEKHLYPVDSMNSRESSSEIVRGSLHKDPTPEESTVGSSSQVKIELSQVAVDAQQVLEEYKVSLPLPEDPTVPSPTTTPLTAEALALSSTNQHPPAEELVDFHDLFKIKERQARLLQEAFVKYPHLWDWKISQKSPRFCKWGYKSLTDMLKLLKSEKPKTMDDSKRKKFEDLCLELESFGFDKEWLASIRQRVMDMQVDHNDKLKQLVQLKSDVSNLEDQLNVARARMDSIEHDLSKLDHVFGL